MIKKEMAISDLITYTFKYFNDPIPFWQIKEEITNFMEFLNIRKPKYVLEIGTAGGGSLFLLTKVTDENGNLISIDLPHGKFGGGYPWYRKFFYKLMGRKKQNIFLIQEDSHSPTTLKKVKSILDVNKLDFIFIDGDHSYEGVKEDFETYSKLLKKGGIIAFHDIVNGPIEHVGGVPRFWDEIKLSYQHIEFVKDWKQGGYGIGVLYL